ncbi:uncharacterized protein FOMMEDRAFT_161306 [Fomitiporia mediterranea MF3/22]|uniref:uncharacterized protein n=1 Tax=Fomitiporia mediterranea (strain MF3/22) TaxID=694068 RepID=UPI00044079EF|nr:uncharacterized protein FOMMEDRAFT_161306 [Fomitiporia mediterranea MF3/22]EJC99074.1 hypothetical protein FOMMEDRAFT_161306 [Fomitiporia mediterranea MF3/22]
MLSTSVEQYSCSFTWWLACSSAVVSSLLASSAIGIGSCPRGGQGASDEEGNRHAAVDVEQEGRVPKIEQNGLERTEDDHCYVHRTQHSKLICLLEQPVLPLHAMGNFDAPAKNMQQTDSAAQHTEWLPTADSEGDIKKIGVSLRRNNYTPAQSVAKKLRTQLALRKVTERLRSCYRRPREKIESAWRTELREKIARGKEKDGTMEIG